MPTVRGRKTKTKKSQVEDKSESFSRYSDYQKLKSKQADMKGNGNSKIVPVFLAIILFGTFFAMSGIFSPDSLNTNHTDQIDDSLKLEEENYVFNYSNLQATLISSPTCGCCHLYVEYLERFDIEIDFIRTENYGEIKAENSIPIDYQSCHTMLIEGYFVEGHIPIVAIGKLLDERPDIDGISLPGMPAGSPGMDGDKSGPFRIFSLVSGSSIGMFAAI